jgi:hypothetical protein
MSGWFLKATEEEKDQALRNADSAHKVDVIGDSTFDNRTEEQQIENKYIGYLGEIVICKKFGWTRHFPPGLDTWKHGYYDAIDNKGQNIEIKTRRSFYPNYSEDMMVIHTVEGCDLAVLLYLFEEEGSGETYVVMVKRFEKFFLLNHHWDIWISRTIWTENLRERKVPERFL